MKWQIKAGEGRLAVAPEIPDYERDIHDPFLLKDVDKAVERILTAVKNNERILVMFSGISVYPIVISKNSKAKEIYAPIERKTKRQPYLRSAYFKKRKIFFSLFTL